MSTRLRLGLITGLVVLLALVAFEAVFYLEVLADGGAGDAYLIEARAPRALLLGAVAACVAAVLAGWLGGLVLRGMTFVIATAAEITARADFSHRLNENVRDRDAATLTHILNQLIARVDRML